MRKAYLDNHTKARPLSSALENLALYYKEKWCEDPFLDVEKMQQKLLSALGAEEHLLHFCSSGAEAIHTALFSHYYQTVKQTGQNHILMPQIEPAPFLLSAQRMEEWGCAFKLLSVNSQGQITKEMLLQSLRPRTGLLSISWAQNLTGVIHPIADLAEVCKERNIALHVDASSILGKLYFRLNDIGIDYFTCDGKLLHAPHRSGALITKNKTSFAPLIVGDNGAPAAELGALTEALVATLNECDHMCLETARLRDKLERGIKAHIPGAVVFFEDVERLPHCTSIGFPGASGEALLFLLQRHGVYASIGGGQQQRLSHVLISSGIDTILAESALSFALSCETTEAEIDYAIETITACAMQLKKCSSQILLERS